MRWKYVLGFLLLLGGGCLALGFFWPIGRKGGDLRLPGVVEIQEVRLGSKVGGRVEEVFVHEGDRVKTGDKLVSFEVPELKAQRAQVLAQLHQAELEAKKAEDGPRPQEIEAAQRAYESAEARYRRIKAGFRQEEKDQAKSELDAAEADLKLANQDFERISKVLGQGAVTMAEYEISRATRDRSEGRARAARARYALVIAGSRPEEIDEAMAELARTSANYALLKEGTRAEDKLIAQQKVAELKARLAELDVNLQEADVLAREPAVIEVVAIRKGDLVTPNQPILRILRDADIWVRVYVPETQLDRVHLHQAVELTSDSGQHFTGEVFKINTEPEFTPRNVQSADERRHQVFGVKIQVTDPRQMLKPGMAVEVTFQ